MRREDFLYCHQGHAFGAPGRPASAPVSDASTREHRGIARAGARTKPVPGRAAGSTPTPGGRPAAPCRAGALWARRRHQVSRPAPAGRQFPQQRAADAPRPRNRQDRPPRAGHSLAAQRSPSRARPRARRCRDGAAPPLTLIFHGKTRHLSRGRGRSGITQPRFTLTRWR
jgi:hypothetical protein